MAEQTETPTPEQAFGRRFEAQLLIKRHDGNCFLLAGTVASRGPTASTVMIKVDKHEIQRQLRGVDPERLYENVGGELILDLITK